jgi:hypothetical protein
MEQNETPNEDTRFAPFIWLLVVVIVVQILVGVVTYLFLDDWQDRGSFGDMFGVVNTLFSGAAFAGIIYAILLQRRELGLQRRELEMTRKELERSAQAQEESSRILAEQVTIQRQLFVNQIDAVRAEFLSTAIEMAKGDWKHANERFPQLSGLYHRMLALPGSETFRQVAIELFGTAETWSRGAYSNADPLKKVVQKYESALQKESDGVIK